MYKSNEGINSLDDLGSLDEKGRPVQTRLKDVKSAINIFNGLRQADEASSINRARIDAMFDGASPYNQAQLTTSGQGLKTNLNFGEAQRLLDISLSAYVDLYSSLEKMVDVKSTLGNDPQAMQFEEIVSEEITQLLRCWPEFHSHFLRLCTTFIKHGVAVSYFDTPDDWKFRVGGFSDILIPRQTPSSENMIDVAVGRRDYHLHELFAFIKDEKVAKKVGWDVEEVKRVIMKSVKTDGRNNGRSYSDWETMQSELKNNDIYTGYHNPTVSVLHFWVKEMDGSISHYICGEKDPKSFLYKKISRYEKPEQAYVIFSYGVGSNGTYHSVRGLGHRIFNHIQTSNRLRCQMIDGAMLGSAVMIQPENQRALDELGFTYYGAYAVLSPNVNIIEKAVPNLSTAVQPALNDISNQLALNTDTVSAYGPNQSSPYRNQLQVASDLEVTSRISGASINLFYASWNRLLREVVRRVVEAKKPDGMLKDFYARCAMRGVPEEFIRSLDTMRTKAVRSIGNGSRVDRLNSLKEMLAVSGSLPEQGRKNLTRDIVSTRVGHDLADRYAPQDLQPRPVVDNKIAYFENQEMLRGRQVPVNDNEMHSTHLFEHLPILSNLIEELNLGTADPVSSLPALQSFYQHIAETLQFIAADPSSKSLVSSSKQVLNLAEEMINNTSKKVQKMQREAMEQQAEMQQSGVPQDGPSSSQMKMQEHQMKLEMARQKAELDMELKQAKFRQDQAIQDAKAVAKLRKN